MFLNMLLMFAEMSHPVSLNQLKRELVQAEQELVMIQQRISSLGQDIAKKELALIKEELEILHAHAVDHKFSSFYHNEFAFQQEREILSQIIKTVPYYREEAFHLQDEVLSLITNFRDEQDIVLNEEDLDPLR